MRMVYHGLPTVFSTLLLIPEVPWPPLEEVFFFHKANRFRDTQYIWRQGSQKDTVGNKLITPEWIFTCFLRTLQSTHVARLTVTEERETGLSMQPAGVSDRLLIERGQGQPFNNFNYGLRVSPLEFPHRLFIAKLSIPSIFKSSVTESHSLNFRTLRWVKR